MIAWLNPAAAIALTAAALPLIIHLLLRHRAKRIVVPSVRFIPRTERSLLHVSVPTDLTLLIVRTGILTFAAAALMQPILVTAQRRSEWSARVVRAVVADTSESVDPAAARLALEAEEQGTFAVRRFESPDLPAVIPQALSWLNAAPPAKRELVVLSDFQLGAIDGSRFESVPRAIGVRAVRLATRADQRSRFDAGAVVSREGWLTQRAELTSASTHVMLVPRPDGEGLELEAAPTDEQGLDPLLEVLRAAGAVAPAGKQQVKVRFRGATASNATPEPFSSWSRAAVFRLLSLHDAQQLQPRLSQQRGVLVVDSDLSPASVEAASLIQSVLNASRDDRAWLELEPTQIDDEQIGAWRRETPDLTDAAVQRTEDSDARWFWSAALLLMAFESILRRSREPARDEERARAA